MSPNLPSYAPGKTNFSDEIARHALQLRIVCGDIVMTRLLAATVLATGLAACAGQPMAPDRDPRGEAKLAQALAGKVAGRPVTCLPHYRTNQMEVIDRDTILYRDGRTSYVQHTNGYCYPNGPRGGYYLVTRQFGTTSLCRGDIAQVLDSASRTFAGSCSFNDFTPYYSR
jgi:hypothetical protein